MNMMDGVLVASFQEIEAIGSYVAKMNEGNHEAITDYERATYAQMIALKQADQSDQEMEGWWI